MAGDRLRRAIHLDAVADDVEDAATADAGGVGLVDELDRHLDLDHRAFDDPQEVDMERALAHRVELEVARQRPDLLAVDADLGDRGQEPAAMDLEIDLAVGEVDGDRGFFAAIDDGGYHALTTDCPGGPLAHLFADRRRELVTGAHRTTP
jgi:hypothetical protein